MNTILLASGLPHLPGWLDFFDEQVQAIANATGLKAANVTAILTAWFAALIMILLFWYLARDPEEVPGPGQNLAEVVVLWFRDFFGQLLGPYTDRYLPFLGGMFLWILFMNLFPLIPGFEASTEKLSTTLGLGMATFFVTHVEGLRKEGASYLSHFIGPTDPWYLPIIVGPFMVPVTIMEEIIRPISLALRLFFNILGKDILVAVIVALWAGLGTFAWLVPVQAPLYLIKIIAGVIQAIIFTVLSAAYIGGAVGGLGGEGH